MMYLIIGAILAGLIGFGVFLSFIWRRVVPTNQVHIVQSASKKTSYGSGSAAGNVYYKIPSFIPKFGVEVSSFPLSIFNIGLKNYEAYDKGRLPFVVDIAAFFRINDSDRAAERVSNFSELQEQLASVLQGAVRRILGTNELEEIMQDRAKLGQEFTTEVNEQLAEWGVQTAKTIEFMNLTDSAGSEVIRNIMEKEQSRIDRESREKVAENNRSAEMKEIEARRDVALSKTQAEQLVGIQQAETEREVGIAKEKSTQEVLTQNAITTEKNMAVRRVEEVKQAEILKDVAEVKAKQDQSVNVINADTEKQTTIKVAEGNLDATKKQAEGIQAIGAAEAEAQKLKELAPVTAQLTLAEGIDGMDGYTDYLVKIREVEKDEKIGIEQAKAISAADVKVIANGGNISQGIGSISQIFGPQGGTALAGMVEAFTQTEQGQKIVDTLTSKK